MDRVDGGQNCDDQAIQEAASWFARLRAATPTEVLRREFQAWLAESPQNHLAFREIKMLWYAADQPAQAAGANRWYRHGLGAGRRRRRLTKLASLSAVCLLLLCSIAYWRDEGLIDRAFADYATVPGEQRSVKLADGSTVFLDGDTALDASFNDHERDIRLIRGRAWFDVAHDPGRPFVVTSNQVQTRDIGTAFAVDAGEAGLNVTVERGRVAVSGKDGAAVELGAGESISARAGELGQKTAADLTMGLAWRRGLLIMNHTPLEEVAKELARMSSGRVILRRDDSHPDLYLSGVFKVGDPQNIILALRAANLHAVHIPGIATLIYR